ncbi:hypothetical protein KDL01_39550 [Actinospica durhamensis]|uniref:Uncharacterized protein n=1 Tax=Actinospica durhamensis TaxID=1508375 RepID=A0A941EZG5_9ACTN|nr:hypothetical protein [Actinospica durhamensis]MBR7839422.1 hypothetical protein [Actinospica durhamensis]
MTTGTSQAGVRIRPPWAEQTVFALAPDRSYVAEWNGPGAGWTIIGGPASEVYAGSAGVFATDPSTGDIAEYNGTPGSWTQIGGPGAEFVEGGGHLYGIGPDNAYVAEWNGQAAGGWTVIGGPAYQIAAGPAGLVEINQDITETLIYDGTPGTWTQIGGASLGVYSGNAVYSSEPSGLEQWTGGTAWETILDNGGFTSYYAVQAVGSEGLFVEAAGGDFEYNGTPLSWTQIGGLPVLVGAVSQTSVYGFAVGSSNTAAADVEVYSGSGSTWTVIGGPAWQVWPGGAGLAAAGD